MRDKHQNIEEPCEKKFSRTVLKTSGTGDSLAEFNRSCHDAIGAIFEAIRYKAKYVLDADIAKCFDRIDQRRLLHKLNTFPTMRRQIKSWLKAGVMDEKELFPTSEGTPQGGVISPLLANIALHGMEYQIKQYVGSLKHLDKNKKNRMDSVSLIRYADDFVILHKDLTVVQGCQTIISDWLKDMGLELKPSKTRLAHTLNPVENDKPGFNFLGFNIRQFAVGKYHSGKTPQGKLLGFKTIITPSQEKVKVHYDKIVGVIDSHRALSQTILIQHLNPIIRGWSNYYSTVVSKVAYAELESLVYRKLLGWAKRRHPKKNMGYVVKHYWMTIGDNNWVFATRKENNPLRLLSHADTPIVRHIKVKGEASPYDGNLVYWSKRKGESLELPRRVATLLHLQKGICPLCNLYFLEEDVMEIDHIIPKSKGGKDAYDNWQLLHRHCHDKKTASDGSLGTKSGCNSAEPKPTRKLEIVNGRWAMRCV